MLMGINVYFNSYNLYCKDNNIEKLLFNIERYDSLNKERVRYLLKTAFELQNFEHGLKNIDTAKLFLIPQVEIDQEILKSRSKQDEIDQSIYDCLYIDTLQKGIVCNVIFEDINGERIRYELIYKEEYKNAGNNAYPPNSNRMNAVVEGTVITDDSIIWNTADLMPVFGSKIEFDVPRFCADLPRIPQSDGWMVGDIRKAEFCILGNEIYLSGILYDLDINNFEKSFLDLDPEVKSKWRFKNIIKKFYLDK